MDQAVDIGETTKAIFMAIGCALPSAIVDAHVLVCIRVSAWSVSRDRDQEKQATLKPLATRVGVENHKLTLL
jgi:hypothetical protein